MSRAEAPSGPLRAVELLAGLISAGLVTIGAGLLVLEFLAPLIAPGEGLAAATGPGWNRVVAQLVVGVAGEALVIARGRLAVVLRWVGAVLIVLAGVVALYYSWWA